MCIAFVLIPGTQAADPLTRGHDVGFDPSVGGRTHGGEVSDRLLAVSRRITLGWNRESVGRRRTAGGGQEKVRNRWRNERKKEGQEKKERRKGGMPVAYFGDSASRRDVPIDCSIMTVLFVNGRNQWTINEWLKG